MRTPLIGGALVVIGAASCGGSDPASSNEAVGRSQSPIQGGTTDTTHEFTVGIVQVAAQSVALCSGVLLAPNLVATARHCVSQLDSAQIECASSQFAGTVPANEILVTPLATIPTTPRGGFYGLVSDGIVVPTGSDVCGNDIALLILSQSIEISQYVTPVINPPMTDHQAYGTIYTAIGYGVDTPTDTQGTSAGTRRILEGIQMTCIPNDTSFTDCFSDPSARQFIAASEFEGGSGTCEGDSGSGAFDQASFDAGQWVAFGVLSRGGVDADAGKCAGSVYTRFDAWGSLLVSAANQAASLGGYSAPGWTAPGATQAVAGASSSEASCQPNGNPCGSDGAAGSDGMSSSADARSGCGVSPALRRGGKVPGSRPHSRSLGDRMVAVALFSVAVGVFRRRSRRACRASVGFRTSSGHAAIPRRPAAS